MFFSELQAGDVFEAHGARFQKLPEINTSEFPGANAINLITRRLAFFGLTVFVEYVDRCRLDVRGRRLRLLVAGGENLPAWRGYLVFGSLA